MVILTTKSITQRDSIHYNKLSLGCSESVSPGKSVNGYDRVTQYETILAITNLFLDNYKFLFFWNGDFFFRKAQILKVVTEKWKSLKF